MATQFNLKEIIKRCFDELEEATFIIPEVPEHASEVPKRIMINEDAIADHISKTLIGELLEFEIIRKAGPAFRSFESIKSSIQGLEEIGKGLQQIHGEHLAHGAGVDMRVDKDV